MSNAILIFFSIQVLWSILLCVNMYITWVCFFSSVVACNLDAWFLLIFLSYVDYLFSSSWTLLHSLLLHFFCRFGFHEWSVVCAGAFTFCLLFSATFDYLLYYFYAEEWYLWPGTLYENCHNINASDLYFAPEIE